MQLAVLLTVTAAVAPAGQAWADTTADRVLGQLAFPYNGANLVDARGVSVPRGVAIDRSVVPNRLYVADTNNNRVLAWADVTAFANGDPAALVVGQTDFFSSSCNTGGIGATSLCAPVGLAVDTAGNLYVADVNNSRVLEYDTPFASGATADRVFGQGELQHRRVQRGRVERHEPLLPLGRRGGRRGQPLRGGCQQFPRPRVRHAAGERRHRRPGLRPGRELHHQWLQPGRRERDEPLQPAGHRRRRRRQRLCGGQRNSRVLEYDTPLASGVTGDRVFGQGGSFTTNGCNLGGVSATSLCTPVGVGLDAANNLYVGDESNHRVLEYDTPLVSGVVADRVFGQGGSFTTAICNVASATSLCNPDGVAADAAGNLYVADLSNSRVLEYDTPLVSGVTADRVLGQIAFVYNGPNWSMLRGVFAPRGVAIDRSAVPSRVYVADTSNHRVLAWANVAAFVDGAPADLVIGQPDFSSSSCNTGGRSATSLCSPSGVAVDAGGNLYVADQSNSRVLEYNAPFATDATADRVFGQGGSFTTGTCNLGGVSATSLCNPLGVTADDQGQPLRGGSEQLPRPRVRHPAGERRDRGPGLRPGREPRVRDVQPGRRERDEPLQPGRRGRRHHRRRVRRRYQQPRLLEYDDPVVVCGNGVVEAGETCDDGNTAAGDCCSPTCTYDAPGTACTSDGNVCTNDVCNGAGACLHPNNTASCDDGLFCNGADTCSGGTCMHTGNPCAGGPDCAATCNEAADNCFDPAGTGCTSDGNVCTNDQCNGTGACAHPNNTAPCDDGLFCNGTDTCSAGACTHTGNPCAGGPDCADTCNEAADNCFDPAGTGCTADSDPCTLDQCNGSGACAHPPGNDGAACSDGDDCTSGEICSGGACAGGTAITCPLCQTCNPAGGCLAAPRSACKVPTQPGKAQLLLRDFTPDSKDQVGFKWTRGQATTFAELGNPLTTDDYALCLFDGAGGLLLKMTAPAGGTCGSRPCWKQIGRVPPKGFKYKDRDGLPDDLDGITIRAGGAGAAKLTLKGKGDNVPLPPLGPTLVLPLKAQLQSENGQCFEGTFSTPLVNTTLDFRAKSD